MKELFWLLFFVFIPCFSLSCCENESYEFIPCEKTYISFDQLYITHSMIGIIVNSSLIETTAIFQDQYGLYFADYKQKKCDKGQWQCRICAHCNPNYKIWCEACSN